MMQTPLPLTQELVLIGGGHSHALVLRRWGMNPLPGVRLSVINPGPTAPYTGMLPGFVAGHYGREDLSIDLVNLARFAGARLILGAVNGIDRAAQRIHVPGRAPVAYDLAAINIGITSDLPEIPGFIEYGIGAKPLGRYSLEWMRFRRGVMDGSLPPEIAVIGGGVGGVELSLAMAHRLVEDGQPPRITVIEKDAALPGLGARARSALLGHMTRLNVHLIEHSGVQRVTAKSVILADGSAIASQFTVGAAGARPQGWLATTGLALTGGFVDVDSELRSSDPSIYASGDCAHLPDMRPKAGVFAVREAPVLYHNLRADLSGGTRRRFTPQKDYLKLISLGGKAALADKYGLRFEGAWLWRWKDRIDRQFMDKFTELPAMPVPALPRSVAKGVEQVLGDKPMCGGCGAKVGGATLASVLANMPAPSRKDVLTNPGDDAAVLCVGGAKQVLTTDHLRAFTEDPWTMAQIAAVHALGDVWAMGAKPQAALASIILPRMSDALQGQWLAEIMDGAGAVFAHAGADIVGGHTSLGSELTIGFSVTGLLKGPAITLEGAKPGDQLILTKPIGSGTILAAEMAMVARGDWVADAQSMMAQPQGDAAACLHRAHAMTDVTGFGLAGHLMGICRASNLGARLDLSAVPFFNGAVELAEQGVRSTLYSENRKITAAMTLPFGAKADLLFDPQTAGGLLAAISADHAETCLNDLKKAGYPAVIIGEIAKGSVAIVVV